MTAGLDRKVKLFRVSAEPSKQANFNNVASTKPSEKLQSIFLPDLPVFSAKFIQDGSKALLSGNRKHFYVLDVAANKLHKQTVGALEQKNLSNVVISRDSGSDLMAFCSSETGHAHLFSQNTSKHLFSLKLNGSCNAACFSPGDRHLFAAGDQGDVY